MRCRAWVPQTGYRKSGQCAKIHNVRKERPTDPPLCVHHRAQAQRQQVPVYTGKEA